MKPRANDFTELDAQYITDENGNRKAVILDIDTFKALVEQVEDSMLAQIGKKLLTLKEKEYTLEQAEKILNKK